MDLLVIKFRSNDLNPSLGKQIEFNPSVVKGFFKFDKEIEMTKFIYKDDTDEKNNNTSINVSLKLSPARGDYKAYQNEDGSIFIKTFLLDTLGLSAEKNQEDYLTIKKVGTGKFEFSVIKHTSEVGAFFQKMGLGLDGGSILYEDKELNISTPTNLILYGPPGTGKTYRMQHDYISKYPNHFVTTFHQSFSYEEFVEGLKAFSTQDKKSVYYEVEPGIFYKACERAAELAGYENLSEMIADKGAKLDGAALTSENTVLLCIDEINRANVSAVFGDLISLIEPSKRIGKENQMSVSLPYSKKEFAVPSNLKIIGTMNTADRSIQLLDSALRRRFDFEELLPKYDAIDSERARDVLKSINNRIRALIGKNYQIGHSYFIGKESDDDIFEVLNKNVIPLLEEYFYEEIEKIMAVLNDTGVNNFYEEDKDAAGSISSDFQNEDGKIYRRKENAGLSEEDKSAVISNIIKN